LEKNGRQERKKFLARDESSNSGSQTHGLINLRLWPERVCVRGRREKEWEEERERWQEIEARKK